jgi:hypothetical protein
MKEVEIGGACGMCRREQDCMQGFDWKPEETTWKT